MHDQKPIWTFPWQVAKGKHWKPVAAVVARHRGLRHPRPPHRTLFPQHGALRRIQDRPPARTQHHARHHADPGRLLSGQAWPPTAPTTRNTALAGRRRPHRHPGRQLRHEERDRTPQAQRHPACTETIRDTWFKYQGQLHQPRRLSLGPHRLGLRRGHHHRRPLSETPLGALSLPTALPGSCR